MARKAFIYGINAGPAGSIYVNSPLGGCVDDGQDMADLLVSSCGFARSDIRLLFDGRATAAAIREHCLWLKEGMQAGDVLFKWGSSHGTLVSLRDAAGNVASQHPSIVPVDFDWDDPTTWLTDVDFAALYKDIVAGVSFTWGCDACHSGTMARDLRNGHGKPRFLPPPADIAWRNRTAAEASLPMRDFAKAIEHLHGVFLGACRADQTAADASINDHPCGAFTYSVRRALAEPNGRTLPMTDVVANCRTWLKGDGYEQEPQIQGDPFHTGKPWLWSDVV